MNDRELLEMAARAAGIKATWMPEYDADNTPCGGDFSADGAEWNPLSDDGDALRLAVKLRMACSFEEGWTFVEARDGFGACAEKHDYRRAIVRAAAEIGRTMTTESVR